MEFLKECVIFYPSASSPPVFGPLVYKLVLPNKNLHKFNNSHLILFECDHLQEFI